MAEVEKGTVPSARRAALKYDIPYSTLNDHISGKVKNEKPGPAPYLNEEEEEELVNFLLKCGSIGYPKTRAQVLAIVQEIMNKRRPGVTVTNGWWERFSKRHPNVCLKMSVPLSYVRAMAEDEVQLDSYFNLLETTLCENDIFDMPGRIYNCDETGMPLNPKPLKVVSERGAKNYSHICGPGKSQITVLACSSAAGFTLPPYVVLPRKTLNHEITYREIPGTMYGLSSKGWMDLVLFSTWFKDHFLSYVPSVRPLLLLIDGHKSHFCPEMIKLAAMEGVILFALPPNTTHLCQPLDKGPFAPLKVEWRKAVHNFVATNKGRVVTIYDFNTVFSKAWHNAMTASNVGAGFRISGIFPFNRNAVKARSEKFKSFDPEALSRETNINYIPLFSPCKTVCGQSEDENSETDYDCTPHSSFLETPHSSFLETPHSLNRSFSDGDLHTLPTRSRKLREFLKTPTAPKPKRGRGPTPKGRVLTSRDNLILIEEQERKKREAALLKEERRRVREEKQKLKKKSGYFFTSV